MSSRTSTATRRLYTPSSVSSSTSLPANCQRSATMVTVPVSHGPHTLQRASTIVQYHGTLPNMIRTRSNFEYYLYSVYRGHQERKQIKKEIDMAIVIQRRYRRHISNTDETAPEVDQQKVLEGRRGKRTERDRAWRDKQSKNKKVTIEDAKVTEKVKQELHGFQDEITELRWQADQQVEKNFMLDTPPARIILISSNIGKADLLVDSALTEPGIIVIPYDFENDTFRVLADKMRTKLNEYKTECRLQSLCLFCQGGPGHLYVIKRKVLTHAKLNKPSEERQKQFWISIGHMMSKVDPEQTIIHIMGCNILANENGQKLFNCITAMVRPNIVNLRSPLELSEEGNNMIDLYFDQDKYKEWKKQRYTKTDSLINRFKET